MTKSKWMSAAALAALLTTATACDDWGRKDPPAGNQVKPTLENVAAFDFEAEEGIDPMVFKAVANPGGSTPEIVADETKGNVIRLDNGYLSLSNPLNNVVLQEAASFTFWMMQPVVADTDEEGNETARPQNLAGPLLTFENATANGRFSINANGGFVYQAPDGEWTENDPATVTTGYLTPGDWHYVAVIVNNDGYEWWVDGDRKVSKDLAGFDCSKIVKFINNVPVMTIGSSDNDGLWLADDIKVYRNTVTAKEIARPNLGNGAPGGPGGVDLTTFEYVVGDPIYNVGSPDCSAAWWTEFSNYYRIPSGASMNFRFVNHTSGGGNWNNWNLCVSTDVDRGGDGYTEYFVIRSDLYGWGESYNGDNWSNEGYGDWDKFRVDMEGAIVNVTLTRTDSRVDVKAVATAKDGTVYVENFFAECGDAADVVRAFFIVDGSYLEFDKDNCYPFWPVDVATANIGQPDCSSAWWVDFSDYFSIPANMSLQLNFTNHTSGGGNWNNWNLCVCTDADRGGDGYSEYFVIRSDLYGWGESYNGDNWSNEGYGDWDKFRVDMEGADVTILIKRNGATVNVEATAVCSDGTKYIERFNAQCGDGSELVRAFLIVDGSYLNMKAADCRLFTPAYK